MIKPQAIPPPVRIPTGLKPSILTQIHTKK